MTSVTCLHICFSVYMVVLFLKKEKSSILSFLKNKNPLKKGICKCVLFVDIKCCIMLEFSKPSLNYNTEIIFILFSKYAIKQYFAPLL